MNTAIEQNYRGTAAPELFKAIDACTTLSELFDLIKRENIVVQMHSQSGASNLKPRKLSPVDTKEPPLERLKKEIKNAICPPEKPTVTGYTPLEREKLIKAIRETTSLAQLFALIQHEGIVIQMHAQSGASNLTPRKLSAREMKDTPFERLKEEVIKSVMHS